MYIGPRRVDGRVGFSDVGDSPLCFALRPRARGALPCRTAKEIAFRHSATAVFEVTFPAGASWASPC